MLEHLAHEDASSTHGIDSPLFHTGFMIYSDVYIAIVFRDCYGVYMLELSQIMEGDGYIANYVIWTCSLFFYMVMIDGGPHH